MSPVFKGFLCSHLGSEACAKTGKADTVSAHWSFRTESLMLPVTVPRASLALAQPIP